MSPPGIGFGADHQPCCQGGCNCGWQATEKPMTKTQTERDTEREEEKQCASLTMTNAHTGTLIYFETVTFRDK